MTTDISEIISLKERYYSPKRFESAIGTSLTFMSNYEQLKSPIIDNNGFQYWNSEGHYMSQRTDDIEVKRQISEASAISGQESRNSRRKFNLELDRAKRAQFMYNSVKAKFSNNPELAEMLRATGDSEIIEKNWWGDTFFGVDDKTLLGANVLGQILMVVRDEISK